MGKIILNLVFIPTFFILSYLIPKQKKLILLGAGFGLKFMGNPKYFFLWLIRKKKKSYNFYWVTRNKSLYRELQNKFPVVYLYSIKGIWSVFRASLLIVEQSSKDIVGTGFLLGKFRILNTLHGTPIKNLSIDDQVRSRNPSDILFKYGITWERKEYTMIACSEDTADKLRRSLPHKSIYILGYPRDDIFFDNKIIYKDYLKALNLTGYKKIFLYAPTLRDYKGLTSPFSTNFLKKLNVYLNKHEYIFLIRTHPLAYDKIDISGLSNIVDITKTIDDIQEILIHTDVLIADYSSLIFDYLLTRRPIIFYPFDYKNYIKHSRNMYYDYFSEMPGPFARNEKELFLLISTVSNWAKDVTYKKNYTVFNRRFNKYQDGKSSERLYELLHTL